MVNGLVVTVVSLVVIYLTLRFLELFKVYREKPVLTLIRGLPGSGKSTYAETLVDARPVLLDADQYFMEDGVYRFDPSSIKLAHEWCQATTKRYLSTNNNVVVANTFTKIWEMQPYFDMAQDLGLQVTVVKTVGEFGSIHDVPSEHISIMRGRWEDYAGETPV